jgi:CubicO group peptidase (beta-lactamase class C family)
MTGDGAITSSHRFAAPFDEKKIDAIFADLDHCHLPGAAVGIAIGGRPVYRRGFGLANMELPVVLSPTMRMRIGSTTKHFAALAFMLLCEDGKAGIDDPIGAYLPELHPATHEVTLRQLMGHIGGLRDSHDISWSFSGTGRPIACADLLSLYRHIDDANAAAGTTWSYNNGGYLMLSVAIERITGQSFEEVLSERIFKPVGMHDTLVRRWDTDFVPNSATLHMTNLAGGFEKSYLGTALSGEGGIVSTVDDMLRWLAHMDAPIVGTSATWSTMKAPQTLANGTSTNYGLGLITSRYRGVEILSHPGGVMGGNSQMLKVPSAALDIVIMVNRHDVLGMLLVNKVLDACLSGLDPVREASNAPLAAGIFRSPKTGRVVQLFAMDRQQMASINGDDMQFAADDDGVLRPAPVWGFVEQTITLTGGELHAPTSIRLSDFGNGDELFAEKPADVSDAGAIAGRYLSASTCTDAKIFEADDGARLSTTGRFGSSTFRLECLAEGIWRAKSLGAMALGGILLFDGDSRAFRYSNSRTCRLLFQRDT